MTGLRNGVMNTLGPNLRRLVRAATAAIAVIGSGTGSGDDKRSENHSESISLFSHSSTNRQKKSRPAGPGGHGPGITPMRYLMRMVAILARASRPEPLQHRYGQYPNPAAIGRPGWTHHSPAVRAPAPARRSEPSA